MQSFSVTAGNDLIETTPRTPADQTLTLGIRKLAFFEYENRDQFYNGTETNNGKSANVGNAKVLEYLFEYSKGRQQRREFENSQMFVRYLANYWVAKVERTKNELVDLDYKLADLRLRLPVGKKISLSIGAAYRTYEKAYGVNPIESYLENNYWWNLSRDYYGHNDVPYSWENFSTGETGIDYFWYDQNGVLISNSDLAYRENIFGKLVNQYNAEQLDLVSGC